MRQYTIEYKEYSCAKVERVYVLANDKFDAYEKALDAINKKIGKDAYSFWVSSVTYNNGKQHIFNNFEGKPL